jgi:hypothetical protein
VAPAALPAGAAADEDDPPDEHAAASPAASSAPAIIANGRLPGGLRLLFLPIIGRLTLHWMWL